MTKKVLHLVYAFGSGGVSTYMRDLFADGNSKFENHFLSFIGKEKHRSSFRGMNYDSLGFEKLDPSYPSISFKTPEKQKLNDYIRENQIDAVVTWHNIIGAYASQAKPDGVPLIWGVQDSRVSQSVRSNMFHEKGMESFQNNEIMGQAIQNIAKIASRYADKMLYCGYKSRDAYEKRDGFPVGNSVVIQNSVDSTRYSPNQQIRNEVRRNLGIGDNEKAVIFVGNYNFRKNIPLFLKTAEGIMEEKPNTHFIMVGKNMEYGNHELTEGIKSINATQNFHLLGLHKKMEELYPAMDLYLSTSRSEGLSLALLEAMSSQVPVVTTDVGDARDAVGAKERGQSSGEAGFVYRYQNRRNEDTQAISYDARKLSGFALEALKSGSELGKKARERVLHKFDITKARERFDRTFEEVIDASLGKRK